MRPIDAESVLYYLVEEGQNNATKYGFRIGDTIKFTPTQVDEIVSKMPIVEPERKTGKWKEYIFDGPMGQRPKALRCSCCNALCVFAYDYCPKCGADMRRRTDE